MKVLFIGDPHLKITRFDLAKQFLVWINSVIANYKPDLVVNLGDTFDSHAVLRSEVMTEFMVHVDECRAISPYIYLVGNHDMYKPNDSKYHALSHLIGKIPNFYIVDKPQNLFNVSFVPYIFDPNSFPKNTLSICVAHQTFKGADYGDITTKDGVDADIIDGCQLIISGHIHKRQRFKTQSGVEVRYVGSPFSQNISDINQIKGVCLIDLNSFEEIFIECPLPMWKGLKYEINPSFSLDKLHNDLINQLNDKDHWVIEITGPKAEIVGYLGSKEAKNLFMNKDVKVKTVFTDKEKRQIRIEAVSLSHIISEYIDKVYSGSLDKDVLKKKAFGMLNKQ